ncbi:helix-turn-helix domain-containing protein [Streptomyces sp. NPDC048442]|uniref:helix-turn-helix domain-containing protein n=1 Tax=Streptomyces sp. NPDC048442 TaxID=3154823 RepID=UPI00343673BE
MAFQEFDTASLPPEYRFECLCAAVGQGAAPHRATGGCAADFSGRARSVALGPVRLTTMPLPAQGSDRCAKLVRSVDPDTFELTLVFDGAMKAAQEERRAHLDRGDAARGASSRPYGDEAPGGRGDSDGRALILHLPQELVPLPRDRVRALFAHGLPRGHSGMSRVLAHYLQSVAEEAETLDEGTGARLGATGLDLASGFFAEQIGIQERLPPETRRQVLLGAINTFIDENLADPHLTPETVAARHHISVRHLHQLFRHLPETVAARIRRRRLERCHQDLASPHLGTLPVHAVGARWGLTSAAGFSRSFRAMYGMAPGEYRSLALPARDSGTAGVPPVRTEPCAQ